MPFMPTLTLLLATATRTTATTAATTANPFMWYVTRAAAVSSYITLTIMVLLGLARSLVRIAGARASWMLDETHQFLAILTAALVALHLLSLMLDALMPFSLLNLLLPFAQPYKPLAVDLGVLGLYALLVVLVSSWLRRHLTHERWRLLHYTGFAVFLLVTLHGIFSGSDSGEPWMIVVYLVASASVILLTLARFLWLPSPYATRSAARGKDVRRRFSAAKNGSSSAASRVRTR